MRCLGAKLSSNMLPSKPTSFATTQPNTDIYDITLDFSLEDIPLRVQLQYGGHFTLILVAHFYVRSHRLRRIMSKVFITEETPLHRLIQMAEKTEDMEHKVFRAIENQIDLIGPLVLEVMNQTTHKLDRLSIISNPPTYAHIRGIQVHRTSRYPCAVSFDLSQSKMKMSLPFLIEAKVY